VLLLRPGIDFAGTRRMSILQAVLFDLDGTLVDSNETHVEAWVACFAERGHGISAKRIRPEIGLGGEQLVRAILGRDAAKLDVEQLPECESERYRRLVAERKLQLLPGAKRLLEAVRAHGLRSALASSSRAEQLEATFASVGVDLRELVDATTGASDVAHAKPEPDLLHAAAGKLGIAPEHCVYVGDTPHDLLAAELAGAPSIGIACGAWSREELLERGASSAWDDPGELAEHLDAALEKAAHAARELARR
jgi:HAD superfamily hydrolase (TIGR01509 family)